MSQVWCAKSFLSVQGRHPCFHFAKEESELTGSQCPGSQGCWVAEQPCGVLDSVHLCLDVTDQGQPVLPTERLSHPPLPKLSSWQSVDLIPAPLQQHLGGFLTQSFLSPSSLHAGLTFPETRFLCAPPLMTDCQFLLFPTTLGSITSA